MIFFTERELVILVMKFPPAHCLFAYVDLNLQPGKINRMRLINSSMCMSVCTLIHMHVPHVTLESDSSCKLLEGVTFSIAS